MNFEKNNRVSIFFKGAHWLRQLQITPGAFIVYIKEGYFDQAKLTAKSTGYDMDQFYIIETFETETEGCR